MSSIEVRIVFPAVSKTYQFSDQTVNLGGVFPQVEVVNLDTLSGLHHFKIPKRLTHAGRQLIDAAVAEAARQIEYFCDVLSFVRDAPLWGQVNGSIHRFLIRMEASCCTCRGSNGS